MATKKKARPFVKMYATGNDFVVLESMSGPLSSPKSTAKSICNRATGIGCDQLLVLQKSRRKEVDFKMQAFNPDGSEAEMCGNGIRCVAKHVFDSKLSKKKTIAIETKGGIKTITQKAKQYVVNMGEPAVKGKDIGVNLNGRIINRPLKMDGKEFRITCVGMGNPHCVVFIENVPDFPVAKFGPMIETYHAFPKKINVEFVEAMNEKEIQFRVWERGTGETSGCGTGACAAAVAGVLNGQTERTVTIKMPGGNLKINWDRPSNEITMTGPAETVFSGEIAI